MLLLPAICVLSTLRVTAAGDDLRLVEAVQQRDAATAQALLAQGIDVNAARPDGATALHWAAHWDDLDTAGQLLDRGASVDVANVYGVTPLTLACVNGSAPMVQMLLESGANPDAALPSGETALMTAARTGRADAVKALLARGANANAQEAKKGQTALMWAMAERHLETARVLIEGGADVNARSFGGFSSLLFATREGDVATARLLLAHGSDVNEVAADGTSALHVAAMRGHVQFAKYLLEQGADPDASGPGYTAMHFAAGRWESTFTQDYPAAPGEWGVLGGLPTASAREELITALLQHGADPDVRLTTKPPSLAGVNVGGATAFYLAAGAGDVAVMRLLLGYGTDPALTTGRQETPLMAAAGSMLMLTVGSGVGFRRQESRHLDAARLCLEVGIDVNAADEAGNTALHVAARKGFDPMIEFLVAEGAAVNARDQQGDTPLAATLRQDAITVRVISQSTVALLRKLGGVTE